MRHFSYVPLRDLDLTEEELAFLQPQAAAMFTSFAKATRYDQINAHKETSFSDFLDRPEVKRILEDDPLKAISVQVIHGIANPSALARAGKTRTLETVLDSGTGLGIEHSSFGGIKIGSPTGAEALLVGSASLGSQSKSIGLTTGRVSVDDDREPNMYSGGTQLIELIMSIEQYCMFIRGNKGILTPCGMSRNGQMADDAPALTHVQSSQRDLKREIRQAAQPMIPKLKAFVELLEEGASKKSDYADLVTAAEQAHSAYQSVAEEISGIVKAAGIKVGDVAKRQFEADMTERMGQLKLGGELNALVRGLSHDTSRNDDQSE